MFLDYWSKAKTRRNSIRESRKDSGAYWRSLREHGGWASIGIAIGFWFILTLLLLLRNNVVRYRPGEYVPHDILARVDFKFFDSEIHDRQVTLARDFAPRVYRATGDDIWAAVQADLLALPDTTHDRKLDQLESPEKDVLDNGAIAQLEEDRIGPARKLYEENVRQFISYAEEHLSNDARPLVILNDADRALELKVNHHPKIILRPATPAVDPSHPDAAHNTPDADREIDPSIDAFSTNLPESIHARLNDWAKGFELALGPKIATLAYLKLGAHPTYVLDPNATQVQQNAAGDHVDPQMAEREIVHDTVIVPKEDGVISDHDWQVLSEENKAYHKSLTSTWGGLWQYRAGMAGVAAIITLILAAYVARYQPRCVRNHTRGISMCALLLSMLMLTQLAGIGSSSLYIFGIAPTILAAMILTIAYDQRFAIGVATLHAFIVTTALNQNLGFFLILWTGVLTACYLLDDIRTRSKLIEIGGAAALAMMAVTAAVGALELQPMKFIGFNCLYTGAAGLAAGFVILGILPFIEKTFRITTSMTLLELADASQPLLRRLALEAPGTYNHSLQVATLAEAAAEAIGANSLACRVGAYYHDVGKINKADYFVENQLGGPSRHLNLTPDLSLRIIIGHVKDGIEMAKDYNLPSSLLPFIHQHHGTTLVEYFYHAAQEKTQDDQPNISEYHFRYPGPKPKSRETAILMMCDAVESATRAMPEPTASRIEKLVHDIAMKRLLDGQFDECDLTMRDLEMIERSLSKTLLGIYHGRIAYPSSAPTIRTTTSAVKSA